jgi:hypothetical protein
MSEIKTLADQLRSRMAKPEATEKPAPVRKKTGKLAAPPKILDELRALDISANKTLVHARFDVQTAQLLHHLKTATGIEVTRVLFFAISQLLEQHPEIKTVVKEHLEQFAL